MGGPMPRIGIVLSGGLSRGAYEIGCVNAIANYFGQENICCISSSSVGVLCGCAYACGKMPELADLWRRLNSVESGRSIIKLAKTPSLILKVRELASENGPLSCECYATIWNFSKRAVEYVPLDQIEPGLRADYVQAAIAMPVVTRSVRIHGDICMDGGCIDNIPVFPLVEKDLDYIFCVYFEEQNYRFECPSFDRKIIKLNHFPANGRLDAFIYDPTAVDNMIRYGYEYTSKCIDLIFSDDDREEIYRRIQNSEPFPAKRRLTADFVMNHISKMMSHISKRKIL